MLRFNENKKHQRSEGDNDDNNKNDIDIDDDDDAVASPNDVLHLNIGGTKATTLRKTLTSIEGSVLAIKFSGRWDDGMEKDNEGNFLIDQEYFLFNHILNYLRNKANGTEKYYVLQSLYIEGRNGDLYRMVEYYGLTNGLYPTKLNQKHMLLPHGHHRPIKSYEVKCTSGKSFEMGWMYENRNLTNRTMQACFSKDAIIHRLMYEDLSHMFETTEAAFYAGTTMFAINLPSNESNTTANDDTTIIRVEDYGMNWYLNGHRLEIPSQEWQKLDLRPQARAEQTNTGLYWQRRRKTCPYIVMKEGMEIINVEIDEAAYYDKL